MINNTLTCLFGFHNYSTEFTKDNNGNDIYLCTICKRNGHYKTSNTLGYYIYYDDNGNNICYKYNDGYLVWYLNDDKGAAVYYKTSDGYEGWKHNGEWVKVKPLNWEYAKYVK